MGTLRCQAIVTLFDWSADSDRPWSPSVTLGDPFDRWWSQLKTDLREDSTGFGRYEPFQCLWSCHPHSQLSHDQGVVHRDIKLKNLVVKRGVAVALAGSY